jgi:hypothetical protein
MSSTTDKAVQNAADKRELYLGERRARDLVAVLETGEGRRVLWRIIDDMARINWVSHANDASTFFDEGRRSVGAKLVRAIQEIAPNGFITMLAEALQEQRDTAVIANGGSAAERKLDNGG